MHCAEESFKRYFQLSFQSSSSQKAKLGPIPLEIIGGSGFIGTRFCGRVSSRRDYDWRILDKKPSLDYPDRVTIADVRNIAALRASIRLGAAIINLAAEHRDNVRPVHLYEDVNVRGAENICLVAREKGVCKIIFTSSVAVYGHASVGTGESEVVAPFTEYGRTKYLAEQVFVKWQEEAPKHRCLVILRPTVVFGERNRGNVFNLLHQIAEKRFVMIGAGENRKSMTYVENVAAFMEHALRAGAGRHIFNCVDKPDFTMNELIVHVKRELGQTPSVGPRIPYTVGCWVGAGLDVLSRLSGRDFPISAVRVKKFCSSSVYTSPEDKLGFTAPVALGAGLRKTVQFEFGGTRQSGAVFYSE